MNDSTVTKADLVEEVVRVTELGRKESEAVVETIFESIIGALQGGDRIEIRGFGSFRTRQRQPRVGRNPKTGARVEVPAKRIPYFKPSKELKDLEQNQLVKRTVYDTSPVTVEYSLTPYGKSLEKVIGELRNWGSQHRKRILDTK